MYTLNENENNIAVNISLSVPNTNNGILNINIKSIEILSLFTVHYVGKAKVTALNNNLVPPTTQTTQLYLSVPQ
jgi:hypothetical protein